MKKYDKFTVEVSGRKITAYKVDNDAYGNPRYVVHYLELGVKPGDYGKIPGLTKYRAKWFGGGYVFQSYNLEDTLRRALEKVSEHYDPLKKLGRRAAAARDAYAAFVTNFGPVDIEHVRGVGYFIYRDNKQDRHYLHFASNIDSLIAWMWGAVQGVTQLKR